MMKSFLAFVKKEFYHIFRDVRTLVILFGIPVVQVTLFGFAITNEVNNAPIMILDHSNDAVTREITSKMVASEYFRFSGYLSSAGELEETFKQGKVKLAVIFGPDFAQKLSTRQSPAIQLVADASDPNIGSAVITYASSIILAYQQEMQMEGARLFHVATESRMMYNPALNSTYYFVPGVITVLLMLISAMMTSITIAREKESGTMEVLLVSPLRPAVIIAGKSVPYVFLALINAVTILVIGSVVFKMPIEGNLTLLLLQLLLFVTTSLSIGILISTLANNQLTALMMSLMGLMLPTILLSGFIFPVESMPRILQVISNIVPARWFIIIIKNIMLKGAGLSVVWQETLVLLGMTIVFIWISVKNFSTRLT
jgi:ABC-2 type transport system permease protein